LRPISARRGGYYLKTRANTCAGPSKHQIGNLDLPQLRLKLDYI
jgi:hypothetical protein